MLDKFFAFIKSPGRDQFLAIREEIIHSDSYEPYSIDLVDAMELLDAGEDIAAGERISGSMPNLLLSPNAHILKSRVAEKSNDQETAKGELAIAALCVKGILDTGDGSHEKPFRVLRTSDEYDILNYLGKQSVEQSLRPNGDQCYDVFRCENGSELWFEITDALRRQRQISSAVYQVRLSKAGLDRVKVMALIREIWGLSPSETKNLIDSPESLLGTIKFRERKDVQNKFTEAGAVVEIKLLTAC